MRTIPTTASRPSGAESVLWARAVARALGPHVLSARGGESPTGRLSTHRIGYVDAVTLEAGAQRMSRSAAQIRAADGEFVVLALQDRGRCALTQDGRTVLLEPGGLVLISDWRPYALDQFEPFRMRLFRLPRTASAADDGVLAAVTATALPRDGAAAVLVPLLGALAGTAPAGPPHVGEQLAGVVTDLVGALVDHRSAAREPDGAAGTRRELVLRVRDYVNRNLASAELSPETIAAHHHISVRYLHRAFQGEGTTLSRWIQQRRLQECCRELARRDRASLTVSAVAQRWGFVNPAHFSRVFRAAYGMSPREWRTEALGRHHRAVGG